MTSVNSQNGTGKVIEAAAVRVGLGETRTINVEAFADTSLQWTLDSLDARALAGYPPRARARLR